MYFALLLANQKIFSAYRDACQTFSEFIKAFCENPCSFGAPDAGA